MCSKMFSVKLDHYYINLILRGLTSIQQLHDVEPGSTLATSFNILTVSNTMKLLYCPLHCDSTRVFNSSKMNIVSESSPPANCQAKTRIMLSRLREYVAALKDLGLYHQGF